MRRWNRPILANIVEKGLDPKKNYKKLDKSGSLVEHLIEISNQKNVVTKQENTQQLEIEKKSFVEIKEIKEEKISDSIVEIKEEKISDSTNDEVKTKEINQVTIENTLKNVDINSSEKVIKTDKIDNLKKKSKKKAGNS